MSKKDSQISQGRANRGFATLSAEEHRKIASLGGKAAHAKGTAHEYTSANAHLNGRKGFAAMKKKYGGEEGFREHMAKIGKVGAAKRNENRSKTPMVNMPPGAPPEDGANE